MSNLLAQRKDIKRLEKALEKQRKEEEEERTREDEEARERAIQEFEAVQMGLEVKLGSGGKVVGREGGKVVVEREEVKEGRGKKRKFEIDEEELLRIAREERGRAKIALSEEKVRKFTIRHYTLFVDYLTPGANFRCLYRKLPFHTSPHFGFPHKLLLPTPPAQRSRLLAPGNLNPPVLRQARPPLMSSPLKLLPVFTSPKKNPPIPALPFAAALVAVKLSLTLQRPC